MKTTDRLSRLLILVPYLLTRPGIRISDAATDFGVDEETLRDDLQLLFVCGLPGYGPGDLIDMSLDQDTVTITYDAGMSRPLRLTSREALALTVALRALADVPGLAAAEVVSQALAKVEAATGEATKAAAEVAVRGHASSATMYLVSEAVAQRQALHIAYYSAHRDAVTERIVDPIRLLLVDGTSYLEAWCRKAEGMRLFRLDRIDAVSQLDEPAAPPEDSMVTDIQNGVFSPPEDAPVITLRVGRSSRWITEYYACEHVEREANGRWLVSLRASNLVWARRLIMGLGDDVEVVAPAELIADIAHHARAALANYP